MTAEDSDSREWGIDRRTVLQGLASGVGIAGISGIGAAGGSPGGGGPCFKDFSCDDGTYVKFEFVIETDDDGNIIDCYFEEETDTGFVEVTYWEDKNGNVGSDDPGAPENANCEPVYVEWESTSDDPTYIATEGLAFGGDDCDEVDDPEGGSYTSGLENEGGNTAAISNLQFCVFERVDVDTTVSVGFEDLPIGAGNDYDYNDWLATVDTTVVGVSTDDGFEAQQLELTFTPRARGAAADHRFGVNFPDDPYCSGTYDISYSSSNTDDDEVSGATFTPGQDVVIFERTSNVLSKGSNTGADFGCGCCEEPDYTATLTINFDSACTLDPEGLDLSASPHGSNLSYKPYIEVFNSNKNQNGARIDPTDERILTVPEDWSWPEEKTAIWNVYGGPDSGTVRKKSDGTPEFQVGWSDGDVDSSKLADCDP